jgi:hypothetical protein
MSTNLRSRRRLLWLSLLAVSVLTPMPELHAQASPSASSLAPTPDDSGWPHELSSGDTRYSLYQPQVDSWQDNQLSAHAAVAVQPATDTEPTLGVVWLSSRTDVDKADRLVSLEDVRITRANFPSAPDQAAGWQSQLQELLATEGKTISLDRLETSLALQQQLQIGKAQPLVNTPPRIIFSSSPAMLVLIDGDPVLRSAPGGLQRVINTRALLLEDRGTYYLHVFDGWMRAPAPEGPWAVTTSYPASLDVAMRELDAAHQVDLLQGTPADSTRPQPSLASTPPRIYVSTSPAELIVTDGAPNYLPIDGTRLLYVSNTTGRVFRFMGDNETYVLISGRWYRARSVNGPWTYVSGGDLPADFAQIPDTSPMENVKASVPSTPQAQEAAIADAVPQTATVERAHTTLDPAPVFDGDPEFLPIEGTDLEYVANSAMPIIETGPAAFYAVQNGVWFYASSVYGPWAVAAAVPPVIYSIPLSSPLHYVTYVRVYGATPTVVYVGYTPGYFGSVLDPDGVVVYGTGYVYRPWLGTVWYGSPWTYGFGAGLRWTPWTGWTFGFGLGWSWGGLENVVWGGWGWGPGPWWGPPDWWTAYAFGPRPRFDLAVNIYSRWDRRYVVTRTPPAVATLNRTRAATGWGVAYNSRTGRSATGERPKVQSVNPTVRRAPTTHVATQRPPNRSTGRREDDLYGARDGTIYRRSPEGTWQQRVGGEWQRVSAGKTPAPLEREFNARVLGEQRLQQLRSTEMQQPQPRASHLVQQHRRATRPRDRA